MLFRSRRFIGLALVAFGALSGAGPAFAQTYNKTVNLGANLGTLNYTVTLVARSCEALGVLVDFTQQSYYNFSYVSTQNVGQPISGSTYYAGIASRFSGSGNCPTRYGPTIAYNGNGYTISISPGSDESVKATMSVPGYVNPKYIVLGVTYAPPGPQSFMNYANSALVSNTSSVGQTLSSGYTLSIATTLNAGILGWANGSTTTTASTSWMQASTNTSSVTVSKESGVSVSVPGPANAYIGIDHDYDVIWVWLNPVALFTLNSGGAVQWNGYGYSTLDQSAMDVVGVYVGCLNGDLSQTSCNSLYQTAFARNWAAVETWPSGQGPGLTSTDLQSILGADPYGRCSPLRLLDQASAPVPIRRASLSRSIKTYSTNNLRQVDSPLQLPTPKATRTRQHKGRERRTPPLKCSVSKRRLVSEESSIPALRLPLASRRL
jgi:hypothetical protein